MRTEIHFFTEMFSMDKLLHIYVNLKWGLKKPYV